MTNTKKIKEWFTFDWLKKATLVELTDVDISKLQTGQLVRVLWRKKPVWIFKRSAEALAALESDAVIKNLSDPDGSGYSKNQQPKYVTTSYRSIKNSF